MLVIPKADELPANFFIVKKHKFVGTHSYPAINAGPVIHLIIGAHSMLVQDPIDHPAPFAAENFIILLHLVANAVFPTMVTLQTYIGNCGHSKCKVPGVL